MMLTENGKKLGLRIRLAPTSHAFEILVSPEDLDVCANKG
jgi:hypothetical protein